MVFLDANVLVYYLDETADNFKQTIDKVQKLVDSQEQLLTSHHVIEEVLHVFSKAMPEANLVDVVTRIAKLPSLILVEPSPNIDFAKRYAGLSKELKAGVNDSLILQLMLDAGIRRIFSYDKVLIKQAKFLGIEQVT